MHLYSRRYWSYPPESVVDQTLIVGLKVVVPDGPRSRLFYFFARFTIASMGILPLGAGHLIAAFRQDKRALHDLVTGSRVIRERRSG